MNQETANLMGTGIGAALGAITAGILIGELLTAIAVSPGVAGIVVLGTVLWKNRPWKEASSA